MDVYVLTFASCQEWFCYSNAQTSDLQMRQINLHYPYSKVREGTTIARTVMRTTEIQPSKGQSTRIRQREKGTEKTQVVTENIRGLCGCTAYTFETLFKRAARPAAPRPSPASSPRMAADPEAIWLPPANWLAMSL